MAENISKSRQCSNELIATFGQPVSPELYRLILEQAFLAGRTSMLEEQLEDHRAKHPVKAVA